MWVSRKRLERLENAVFEKRIYRDIPGNEAEYDVERLARKNDLEQLKSRFKSLADALGYQYQPESTEPAKFVKKGKKK